MYQSLPYYVFYLVLLVSFPWLECKPEDFVILEYSHPMEEYLGQSGISLPSVLEGEPGL